jgi:hypothetical protein
MEMVFSVGSALRLYNENPRPAERELRGSFEMAVENDGEEMATSSIET